MGHARTLITLPEATQLEAASIIVERGLSVRETENLVRQLQAHEVPNTKPSKPLDPDILHLQSNLARQLKMKVAIKCNAKGRGKLIIHYRNLSELDELLAQFQEA
jgi:ParB family chromosome partitioning protein